MPSPLPLTGSVVETTDNRLYRVEVSYPEGSLDCIEVKRTRGGFADKAGTRRRLVQPAYILRTVSAA